MPVRRRKARRCGVMKNLNINVKKSKVKKRSVDLNHIRQVFDRLQELRAKNTNGNKQELNKLCVEFVEKGTNPQNTIMSTDSVRTSRLLGHQSLSTFEMKTSNEIDIFMVHENEVCTARSIYSEMWDKKIWGGSETLQEQYKQKRKIIQDVLLVMTDLDLYILKTILMKNSGSFRGLKEVINNRKKLIYYLMVYMNRDFETINLMTEILQLWFLVQPAVLESCKYTGGIITDELNAILIDVDALYDWIKNYKKDSTENTYNLEIFQSYLKDV